MLPLGHKVTGRRDELLRRADKQIAGAIRSRVVLEMGDFDGRRARLAAERALKIEQNDPARARKIIAAKYRYSDVNEAR